MKEKYLTFVMFVLGCFLTTLMAQTISVKGKVTDDKKTPLPGVSVVVKGSTHGTSTDFDGNFQLNMTNYEDRMLEISYLGYQTATLSPQKTMTVRLKDESQQLEEVVVVGYGSKKKDSSVSSSLSGHISGLKVRGSSTAQTDLIPVKAADIYPLHRKI